MVEYIHTKVVIRINLQSPLLLFPWASAENIKDSFTRWQKVNPLMMSRINRTNRGEASSLLFLPKDRPKCNVYTWQKQVCEMFSIPYFL